jgi:hypothetical protein
MAEELGKIEKPSVENYKGGKKLFFVPLVISMQDLPEEYASKCTRYWEQVDSQIAGLELKLGKLSHIFHELVPENGEKGIQQLLDLKLSSLKIVQNRMTAGAVLEALEDNDILTELMDWSRCLSLGLQNQKVFSKVYESYTDVNKRRNESIIRKIQETLKENETAMLIMSEEHHIQFPADMNVFYIAPPALDEIKRWLRDYEAKVKDRVGEGPDSQDVKAD